MPEKVHVINNFPKPIEAHELRRFLAMHNSYLGFIPQADLTQEKLQKLIVENKKKDDSKLFWIPESEEAFSKCKQDLGTQHFRLIQRQMYSSFFK